MENQIKNITSRLDKLEDKVDNLAKESARIDEKYNTIIDLQSRQNTTLDKLQDAINNISIKLAENDQLTKQNLKFKDSFSLKNIAGVTLAIISILAAWAEFIK